MRSDYGRSAESGGGARPNCLHVFYENAELVCEIGEVYFAVLDGSLLRLYASP
jgi:hypothetical protein